MCSMLSQNVLSISQPHLHGIRFGGLCVCVFPELFSKGQNLPISTEVLLGLPMANFFPFQSHDSLESALLYEGNQETGIVVLQ